VNAEHVTLYRHIRNVTPRQSLDSERGRRTNVKNTADANYLKACKRIFWHDRIELAGMRAVAV